MGVNIFSNIYWSLYFYCDLLDHIISYTTHICISFRKWLLFSEPWRTQGCVCIQLAQNESLSNEWMPTYICACMQFGMCTVVIIISKNRGESSSQCTWPLETGKLWVRELRQPGNIIRDFSRISQTVMSKAQLTFC